MEADIPKAIELLSNYIEKEKPSANELAQKMEINRRTLDRFLKNGGFDPRCSTYNKIIAFLKSVGYIEKS